MGPWVLSDVPPTRDSTSFWAAVSVDPEALASGLGRGSVPHILLCPGVVAVLPVLPVASGAKGGGFEVDATLPVFSVPLGAEGGGFGPGSV